MNKAREYIFFAGLAFLTAFPPIARGAVRLWSETIVFSVMAVLIFIRLRDLRPLSIPFVRPVLVFLFLASVSAVTSIYRYESVYALTMLILYAAFYCTLVDRYSIGLRRFITGLTITVGTGLSAFALMQYFGLFPHQWWMPKMFVASTYVNHNHFAGYLELVIPVALAVLVSKKDMKPVLRLAVLGASALMVAAFLLAQSRGAWIALSVSLSLFCLVLSGQRLLSRRIGLTVIAVFLLVLNVLYFKGSGVLERITTISDVKGDASLSTRVKIWQGTLSMIRHNPLTGTGIGTFETAFPAYTPGGFAGRANAAHNDYLETGAEMGVAAALVVIWLIAAVVCLGISMRGDIIIVGLTAGIFSVSLHNIVDFNFHIPANMILFVMYTALIAGEKKRRETCCGKKTT